MSGETFRAAVGGDGGGVLGSDGIGGGGGMFGVGGRGVCLPPRGVPSFLQNAVPAGKDIPHLGQVIPVAVAGAAAGGPGLVSVTKGAAGVVGGGD